MRLLLAYAFNKKKKSWLCISCQIQLWTHATGTSIISAQILNYASGARGSKSWCALKDGLSTAAIGETDFFPQTPDYYSKAVMYRKRIHDCIRFQEREILISPMNDLANEWSKQTLSTTNPHTQFNYKISHYAADFLKRKLVNSKLCKV